ncbi:hypothetical protein LTR10_006901 [Elasticomyces elasticus]|nr:hypothetical protein LTR10_006901 [Elasticomyces elasticus]
MRDNPRLRRRLAIRFGLLLEEVSRTATISSGSSAASVSSVSSSNTISSILTASSSLSTSSQVAVSASSTFFTSTILSTSTLTSTSSSASASATKLACPASNSTIYTGPQGNTFMIECGIDHQGGDLSSLQVSGFAQCVDACDSTKGCVDVSLSGSACYLKKTLGKAVSNSGIRGAKLVTLTSTSSAAAATSSAA